MTISAPTNPALFLEDGLTTYAPTGGGTFTRKGLIDGLTYVYDTGADAVPKSFVAALQASVLDLSTGDEQYVVTIEGGNAIATDGDGNVSLTGEVRGLDEWSMCVVDQQDVRGFSTLDPLDNTLWRYIRVSIQVSGTTPQIALTAFIRPLSDMTEYEFHELIQLQVFTAENIQNAIACWLPWANGVAGGGPNSDGKYPIYDGFGHSYLLACPRQWSEDYQVDVPLSFGAIGGGFSHPASERFATLADCQAVYPFATSLTQELDYLAMQKAWNTGRKIGSPPITYRMCNTEVASQKELTAISGLTWVEAAGARLNFESMVAKSSDEHYVTDQNFSLSTGTPWLNATIYPESQILRASFGGGEATCIDTGGRTNWTIRTSAADNNWQSVCWSPELGLFCAVSTSGTGNRVMTSPDGMTWTIRTSATDNSWNSVCWSPELGLFCAVSTSGTGNRVMTSPDGVTWTIRTSAADNSWNSVCWSPELGLFCAVSTSGTGNRVMTSPDGVTWTIRTSAADNSWNSVCWSPELGLFCAVSTSGTGNRVMTSPNGVTWTIRTSAADNSWNSVCWSPELGLFCAVASSGTGNRIMTSPDGVTWTIRTSAADNNWRSVCWSPELGLFCAVAATGSGNSAMTSPDGLTWTAQASAVDNGWRSVCWSPELGLFCAVAQTGTSNRVMTALVPSSFFQFGQMVTLQPGRYTGICTYEAAHGGSYAYGNSTIPYASISFSSDSPGEGSNFSGRGASSRPSVTAVGATDTVTMSFDFEVTEETTAYYTFTAGGWADWHITQMDIIPSLLNCAVLLTRDGAIDHYPIMQPLSGLWIEGPGYDSGITGLLWKSFSNTDGNVMSLASCNVTGFEYGLETSDGAYLLEIERTNLFSNGVGYRHRAGALNAGENIRIRGGGIYNNGVGIDNIGGAEINILHTAIDYNGQAIRNNLGTINMSLLRVEQKADDTLDGPIFHCLPGGKITASQVRFLGAGVPATMTVAPIQLDSAMSSATFHMCDLYNLASASGYVASGPGLLRITDMQNGGNPNIGLFMLSAAPAMDVLNGAGFFEPMDSVVSVSADGIHLEGGLFPEAPHTSIDRWNSDITTIEVSTDYAYEGSRSLKITKAESPDLSINDALHILIPTRGGNLLGGFRILMPHDVAFAGVIYYRIWWVRVIGYDSLGRPRYAPNQVFKGEVDIPVPVTGSPDWITRSFGTLYQEDSVNPATQAGIRPPAWATHLLLLLDHQSNPAMTYYIDALHANEVG